MIRVGRPGVAGRVTAIGLCVLTVSAPTNAAPCDDAGDAWAMLDAGIDAARQGDARAVERAVSTLTDARCTPAGPHAEWVARARLEARLLLLEAHADAGRAGLSRMPRQTGRTGPAYLQWIRRAITPWITTEMATVRAVINEGSALTHDTTGEPGITSDAIAAIVGLELALASAVEHVPMPDEIRRDPDMERTYRSTIQDTTQTLVDSVRDGHRALVALARREAVLPRAARRVEAMLLLRGRITASERAGARTAPGASAAPATSAASRPVVEPGRPVGDPNVTVQVPVRALREVVNGATPAIRGCYEQGLDRDRALRGDVSLRVSLSATGGAAQVQVSRADGALRPVASCIADAMRGLAYPAVTGPVTVEFPFHLEPGAPEPNTTVP
ncbi:MAG: AgmX/PglI C-terminal domain-containing protein [Deltaproteobacteria bacterium]